MSDFRTSVSDFEDLRRTSEDLSVRLQGPQCQTLFLVSRPIRAMISLSSSASEDLSVRLCFWFHGRSGP